MSRFTLRIKPLSDSKSRNAISIEAKRLAPILLRLQRARSCLQRFLEIAELRAQLTPQLIHNGALARLRRT